MMDDSVNNNPAILPFLFSAITALAAFCGFMVKKFLELFKDNITVNTEVKEGLKQLSRNVEINSSLIQNHLIKDPK